MPFPFDPAAGVEVNPALWLPEAHPGTLRIVPVRGPSRTISFSALTALGSSRQHRSENGETQVILSGPDGWLRMVLPEHFEHMNLACLVPPDRHWALRSCALARLHGVLTGMRPPRLRQLDLPGRYQRHRLDLLLRLVDARLAAPDVTTRELAERIVFPARQPGRAIDWKNSSERRQVHRLLRAGEDLVAGGYRRLLTATSTAP